MWNLKNYTNKLIYKTHRLKERIYGYGDWGGEVMWRDRLGVWD